MSYKPRGWSRNRPLPNGTNPTNVPLWTIDQETKKPRVVDDHFQKRLSSGPQNLLDEDNDKFWLDTNFYVNGRVGVQSVAADDGSIITPRNCSLSLEGARRLGGAGRDV